MAKWLMHKWRFESKVGGDYDLRQLVFSAQRSINKVFGKHKENEVTCGWRIRGGAEGFVEKRKDSTGGVASRGNKREKAWPWKRPGRGLCTSKFDWRLDSGWEYHGRKAGEVGRVIL